jgi:hypothetical protein
MLHVIIITCFLAGITACNPGGQGSSFNSDFGYNTVGGGSGSGDVPFSIGPTLITLSVNNETAFTASNGTSPYTFSIVAGTGSIDANSGVYTAPSAPGMATIRVSDSSPIPKIAEATVRVNSLSGSDSNLLISPTSLTLSTNSTYSFSSSGGATPYTYSLLSGSGSVNSSTGLYTAASSTGTATVRVTDAQGSTSDCGVTILESLALNPSSQAVEVNKTKAYVASGGVGTYSYSIHAGVGTINSATGIYTAPGSSGSATIKVTDSQSNVAYSTITVYEPLTISPSNQSMSVNNNFTFTASGGHGSYSYSVPLGSGSVGAISGIFTAPNFSITTSIVRLTDSLGNTADATVTINPAVSISPSSFTIVTNTTKTFTASGGSGSFTWSMHSGDGSIDASSGQFTAPITNGSSVIKATDSLGNIGFSTITINSTLAISPSAKTLLINGAHTFSSSGGVAPYTYSVMTPSGGTINSSSGAYTAPSTSGGPYTIRSTDSLGNTSDCILYTISSSTLAISPSYSAMTVDSTQTFSATGGTAPYTFSVVSGEGSINASSGLYTPPTYATTAVIAVTDANNYTITTPITVSNPKGLGGLKVWFDTNALTNYTNGDQVSNWEDQSGNNVTSSQSTGIRAPYYQSGQINGKPGLLFDHNLDTRSNVYLTGTGLSSFKNVSGITAFVVSSSSYTNYWRSILKISSNNAANPRFHMYRSDTTRFLDLRRLDADATQTLSSATFTNNQFSIDVGTVDYVNQVASYYVNGAAAGSTTGFLTSGNTDNTDSALISIGGDNNLNNYTSNGVIAEVLIYNKALSVAERKSVEIYLADKYGLYHPNANWITNSNYSAALKNQIINYKLNKGVADDLNTIGIDYFPSTHFMASQIQGKRHNSAFLNWPDVSGMNNHASFYTGYPTLNKGTVNNQPTVRLANGQCLYNYNQPFHSGSGAMFVVFRIDPSVTATIYKQMDASPLESSRVDIDSTTQTIKLARGYYSNPPNVRYTVNATPNNFGLMSIVNTSTTSSMWYNGGNNQSGSVTISTNQTTWGNNSGFGDCSAMSYGLGATSGFSGNIAEVISYPYSLNSIQRQAVENYLRTKYNLW